MAEQRALVVGGGLAGLGAAIFFRRLGLEVTLAERLPRLGALIRGFRRGTLDFETGFHYAGGLNPGGVLTRYLDRLGLLKRLTLRPLPEPGGETLRFTDSGRDFRLPGRFSEFRQLLPAGPAVDAFFQEGRSFVACSPFLNPDLNSLSSPFSPPPAPSLERRLAGLPLNGLQKCLVGFRCLLYGSRPDEADLGEFSLVNQPYLDGAAAVEGGGAALALALEEAAAENGVEVKCGARVTALETGRDNMFQAARLETVSGGERVAADFCVFTGPPAALPELLPAGALRPTARRRLAALKETRPPFLLFGHTGRDFLGGRQLFLGPKAELSAWFRPERGAVYLSGGQGRGGRYPLTAVALMPEAATAAWRDSQPGRRPPEYLAFKRVAAETLRRRILAACPEFEGDLEIVDSATDLTLRGYAGPGSGGGIYGRRRGLDEAPLLPMTRVGRLALAGQNVILPGLLGALVSAAVAVGVLAGPERVLEVLRR